ncbi:MAG: outer membrane protein [Alphaproteobacteria bacterium]
MKKLLLAAALTVAFASPSFALGPYVEIFAGRNSDDSKVSGSQTGFDDGYIYGAAAGMELGIIRAEAEIFKKTNDFNNVSGEIDYTTVMTNAYFDFGLPLFPITPYIGAGVGYTDVEVSTADINDSDQVTTYQVILGAEASIPGLPFDITADYRYVDSFEDATVTDNAGDQINIDTKSQAITVGMKFGF